VETPDPVVEFGALQVEPGQDADLRPLFAGRPYLGTDLRPGPGVDRVEDLRALTLADGSVGTALCLETLEHCEDPFAAGRELARVVADGGVCLVSTPLMLGIHGYPNDYWRFTPEGLRVGGRTVREHAARGSGVNAAFLIGLSALGLVRGFILAGLLEPRDYGVWGMLVVALGTVLFLRQAGIGDKFVQQDEPDQELAFQKAFTLELAFNGLFALVLAAVVPIAALVYGRGEMVAPGLALIVLLPAAALQAPLWIHYRRMDFARQRTLQAVEPVVGFLVAIALALAGAGYW